MQLIGIGTDITSIVRITSMLERHGDRFARRILHPREYAGFEGSAHPAAYLARRFAAKEAASKALGVGIGAHMRFEDACVDHDERGRPLLVLSGPAALTAERLGVRDIQISLSDEREYALAFVVMAG
ncbi:holo-ACP synthase [Ectothiorhodospira lacustris]|uniref:holo-ACP synthase n=1 Tax=Ectothiorhodospira lacustris TaxID=2899127 RepID=UPI001EE96B73|nr:holo-ACP synthase [Ectothiorhodospira lacustris]MCG5500524.1 holo-ACP synthase [Ectothiorhodospira lacustris]MCG5509403.1 holo-ACP synthase [Ectothiorhodospira lacustris]MCG5521457.1 holo-ACP synthase [Ectothiorhodospira lacustris]